MVLIGPLKLWSRAPSSPRGRVRLRMRSPPPPVVHPRPGPRGPPRPPGDGRRAAVTEKTKEKKKNRSFMDARWQHSRPKSRRGRGGGGKFDPLTSHPNFSVVREKESAI